MSCLGHLRFRVRGLSNHVHPHSTPPRFPLFWEIRTIVKDNQGELK